jgi:hypothetical protein
MIISWLQSSDDDTLELTHRAYWAILLLEKQVHLHKSLPHRIY